MLPGIRYLLHDLRSLVTSSTLAVIPTEFASFLQNLLIDTYVNSLNPVHQKNIATNKSVFDQWICITASLPYVQDNTLGIIPTSLQTPLLPISGVVISPHTTSIRKKTRQQQFRRYIPELDIWVSDNTFSSAITNFLIRFQCTNGASTLFKRDKLRYHRKGDKLQTFFCPCCTKDTFCFQLRHHQHTDVHVHYGVPMFKFRCFATTDSATAILHHFRHTFPNLAINHPCNTTIASSTPTNIPTTANRTTHRLANRQKSTKTEDHNINRNILQHSTICSHDFDNNIFQAPLSCAAFKRNTSTNITTTNSAQAPPCYNRESAGIAPGPDPDGYYFVEALLDRRHNSVTGQTEFLCRFTGYSSEDDEWRPYCDLNDFCQKCAHHQFGLDGNDTIPPVPTSEEQLAVQEAYRESRDISTHKQRRHRHRPNDESDYDSDY